MRGLLPRISYARWGGGSLTDPEGRREDVRGGSFAIQWLGLLVEINGGRVSRRRRAS
ncbi:MAG TPA: hypothetical protein VNQ31_09850 [Sphingomonadaceae bacterium]|nr:hypothetical protein [Sphingomonadaceae bacterium]